MFLLKKKFILFRILLWSAFLIVIEGGIIYIMTIRNTDRIEHHFSQEAKSLEKQYLSVLKTFEITAQVLFEEGINKSEILELYSQIEHSDSSERSTIRKELYQKLLPTYHRTQAVHYRQLHFHLPNNESFLRFHRPSRFGDNLSAVRKTVATANREKKFATGFEEGRIYNGFRYVFPLLYQGKHLGSVETSISSSAIARQLCQGGDTEYSFVIKQSIVNKKVFTAEQNNYKRCFFHPSYQFDLDASAQDLCKNGNLAKLRAIYTEKNFREIKQGIKNGGQFSSYLETDSSCLLVSFVPIINYSNQHVGYFFSVKDDRMLFHILRNFEIRIGVTILLLLVIIGTLAYAFITRSVIRRQGKNLASLSETKNHFFSIIAHDLLSPFNAILGFGQLTQEAIENNLPVQSKQYIELLNSSTQQAFSLLDNLLQWSRSQAGGIVLDKQTILLHQLVNEVTALHSLRAQEKQITLTNQVDQQHAVLADSQTIGTVLRNLTSNAIKFTSEGGSVTFYSTIRDDYVLLSVSDTGMGMDEQQLAEILKFKPGYGKRGTHHENGTGLGLVVCNDFVRINGGKLNIESTLKKGSVFSFTLPISLNSQKKHG